MKQIDYIWIVSPIGYEHSRAFEEVAGSFSKSLQDLGHKAEVTRSYSMNTAYRTRIVFGAHLLTYQCLTGSDIIYNAEQVGTKAIKPEYVRLMKDHEVWDYSKVNIERLEKDHGIKAKHVPIGYHPCMTNPLMPKLDQDIDVLFYGSINQRRRVILDQLKANGLKVIELFGVYGEKLDEYIARSKVVLNVHYYDTAIFEIFRCAYLFANRKCVVSESGSDFDLEYNNRCLWSTYSQLVSQCLSALSSDSVNHEIAERSYRDFVSVSQKSILEGILK
jgi:hypothetical protein